MFSSGAAERSPHDTKNLLGYLGARPARDAVYDYLSEKAVAGDLPVHLAAVQTALIDPFDRYFDPRRHPEGILAIQRTMRRWSNGHASHPVVYQKRDRFILAGDYVGYFAASSRRPAHLPCYILGSTNHRNVRDILGPFSPDRVRRTIGNRGEWNASGNSREQFDDLVELASTGCHDAARYLAECYEIYLKDPASAVRWYQTAADRGDERAVWRLANFYDTGNGIPADPVRALRLYAEAAICGIREAQYAVAELYRTGRGIGQDLAESLVWFRMAMNNGYRPAAARIRECWTEGDGGRVPDGDDRA